MGLFDVLKKVANGIANVEGSETPSSICTELYQCRCGMIRYFPESSTPGVHVPSLSSHKCSVDGKEHFFVRVG